jgi:hypothetical protein
MRQRLEIAGHLLQYGDNFTELLEFLLGKQGKRVRERFHPPLASFLQNLRS